jgi:hypothetical protein
MMLATGGWLDTFVYSTNFLTPTVLHRRFNRTSTAPGTGKKHNQGVPTSIIARFDAIVNSHPHCLVSFVLTLVTFFKITFTIFFLLGKTSTIVAAAKRMYGSPGAYSTMALELNASDARGIDVRWQQFKRRVLLFNRATYFTAREYVHCFTMCI